MTDDAHACDDTMLQELAGGRLSQAENRRLEEHLEHCVTCRQRLEEAVASHQTWREVRDSLGTVASTYLPTLPGLDTSGEFRAPLAPGELSVATDLAFYRSLLGPTDDPAMLGRIGNYEIVGLLGHGGMGIVFKAFDGPLNRYVAVKIMAPQFASSGAAKQRFLREARAAAAVAHEHVIAIHGVSAWRDTPYLVMAYVAGVSLQQRLARSGPLELREVLRIGMQVASGLAAAHEQGLIHRDVKPANILMEAGIDRVVLTDFGLARAVDDIRLTQSDTLLGTPQYMSPEQAKDAEIDYRTDLFSLGSVMYEAISGRPAFHAATSYGVLRKISDHTPVSLRQIVPDVPLWFEQFIARLMAKEPNERFESASDVARLLKHCLAHLEQPATVALPPELMERSSNRFLTLTRGLAMSLFIVSLVIGLGALVINQPEEKRGTQGSGSIQASNQTEDKAGSGRLVVTPAPQADEKIKYDSAQEAYQVGVAFYNSRNFKNSRGPMEAAVRLATDDVMRLKAYRALLAAYREIPEFEPYRDASEFIIDHSQQSAERSLTRSGLISFAYNRGQIDGLIKRYEQMLSSDKNSYLAVFVLSELYSFNDKNPKRAVELLQQLQKMDAKLQPAEGANKANADIKVAREKAKLAQQLVKTREFRQAAKIFEEIAPLDATTRAWNLKEAASAWLNDGNKKEALRLANAADATEPESRNDQLAHFFHRNLGDLFMKLGAPKKAVPHYEIAIEKTKIEGYVKDTKASLIEAKEKIPTRRGSER